jgi:heat shock protein HtpX
MKRIFLFLLTNLAVVLVLSIVLKLFGIDRSLAMQGYNWTTLLVYALVVGFGGAIISLLMSKPMAKWSTGAHIIEQPQNQAETWLLETVRKLADQAWRCRRWAFTRASRMRSRPARSATLRSSRSRPACCNR